MLRRFIHANRAWCARMFRYLPQAKTNFEQLYIDTVAGIVNAKHAPLVVDIGGGRSCRFARALDPNANATILGLDIAPDELAYNQDIRYKIVADVVNGLPFRDASIDVVVSRSVLEHLADVDAFLRHSSQITKPGGYAVHFFPSRYTPFAVVNRLLPNRVTRRLLYAIYEDARGICGFPAQYDRCWHGAFSRSLEANGFELVSIRCGYHQSHYYGFFAPFFLAAALYDWVLYRLDARWLCAYIVIVARKTG